MSCAKAILSCATSFLLLCGSLEFAGCGNKEKSSAPVVQQPPAGGEQQQQAVQLPAVNLTADGLDELLAPIALYPDPVLAVMLQASVNPQEVMDGGNWLALDQNQNLSGAALDQASSKAGFTPVLQALLHYPTVVDQMCTQFDWTKQLGAAYQADPKSVLASVQRLRAQAVDNGALKSSPQMKVNVTQDQGQQVVELAPGDPKTVYVPQYDPSQVYGSTTTTTTSGGTTTTTSGAAPVSSSSSNTTVVQEKSGVSTGTAVLIGLLSFGAGIAVGAAINNNNYYYPAWGHGGVWYGPRPYYPPPYRPVYYGGWHGGYAYNRPVYMQNNVNINVHNNYYNRFNNNANLNPGYRPRPVPYNNRPNGLVANNMGYRPANRTGVDYRPNNNVGTRPSGTNNENFQRPAARNEGSARPPAPAANNANNWKGQSTYHGNKNVENRTANPGFANAGNTNRVNTSYQPARTASGDRGFTTPGGTRPNTGMQTRPSTGNAQFSRPAGNTQPAARPSTQPAARPQPQTMNRPQSSPGGAFGGANNGRSDRAASNRGRASMGASHGRRR
jgi:Protein of unknown function (DUF3300)